MGKESAGRVPEYTVLMGARIPLRFRRYKINRTQNNCVVFTTYTTEWLPLVGESSVNF
jgi:hypothetical protein